MPLWFIEFAICRPQSGDDAPAYVGNTGIVRRIEDCQSVWAKLRWAVELMVPSHRGVGWNWQIKNIPEDSKRHLTRRRWIIYHLCKGILSYLGSLLLLVAMGFASSLEQDSQGLLQKRLVDAMIGWTGAIWIYCRLCTFYSTASAATVALGLYERWQLPPLMGKVGDAWSVRQFWAVYHQTMRQMLSAPAIRITRALGFRKGSLASALCQLYLAFGLSTVVHQFQMFNVTRRDVGEFTFFMSQPVVITLEGAVMWLWRRYVRKSRSVAPVEIMLGYVWVVLWLSSSLPIYLKGSRDAGIVHDAFIGTAPFDFGIWLGQRYPAS
ncbi:hypothetical protein E8E13_010230 [Curvularia kusanoi]|uniref:Wax synthase domain-containing protein n=1 Tax=Curvularia kusanoi TaxID=90978 RepID=A0A9P4TGY6_CURKU|nr:hypothetical protein E8E13_010230 [Curvularia kusanoi]